MKKTLLKKLDYIFVLRPTLLFPVWTVFLAGHWTQSRFQYPEGNTQPNIYFAGVDITLILVVIIYTLLMGSVYILNQIQDIETDKINDKLYLIANGEISQKSAYIQTAVLGLTPLILIAWHRFDLVLLMSLSFILMGCFYSCPPFNFKDRPIGGVLCNFLGGFLVFSVGWVIEGQINSKLFMHAIPYALGILAIYFFTTIPDIQGDKSTGKITIAVKYGKKITIYLGVGAIIITVISSLCIRDLVILFSSILITPFFIKTLYRQSTSNVLSTNKYAILFLSLMICFRYPLYLFVCTFVYFLSKWYFKNRFNISYPSLKI